MEWVESLNCAIGYIENNLTENLTIETIAERVYLSPFYFQRGFNMLTGITVGEYVRNRRLSAAGQEIAGGAKVLDTALKYGYETPESFTKAFTRFHGITPASAKKQGAKLKAYNPLIIKITLEGGNTMDYRIVEKETFTVMGVSKKFKMDEGFDKIPKFWDEHHKTEKCKTVCGMFGICIDENQGLNTFKYMIADNYLPWNEVPDGFECVTIPKHTWAVFPCKGSMPRALQEVNEKIFSEWLPNSREYKVAGGYNVEMYSDPSNCPKGTQDENYYTEIWVPVTKK